MHISQLEIHERMTPSIGLNDCFWLKVEPQKERTDGAASEKTDNDLHLDGSQLAFDDPEKLFQHHSRSPSPHILPLLRILKVRKRLNRTHLRFYAALRARKTDRRMDGRGPRPQRVIHYANPSPILSPHVPCTVFKTFIGIRLISVFERRIHVEDVLSDLRNSPRRFLYGTSSSFYKSNTGVPSTVWVTTS